MGSAARSRIVRPTEVETLEPLGGIEYGAGVRQARL